MNRRTLIRAIGAGSIGAAITGLSTGTAAAATVITMEGGGDDIWGTADAFHYYYEQVSGDFDVVVRNVGVENTDTWAKGGPMVRDSLDPAAANVMVRRRPNGEASMQYRPTAGADTNSVGGTTADWLRLVRDGDTVETYHSTENGNWTLVEELGPGDVDLGDSVYLGLAVTSHDTGTLCTASFQSLSGVSPDTTRDIGDVQVAGSTTTETGVPLVSTGGAADVGSSTATLTGELTDLGGADSAECYFEYREVPTESWEETESATLTSTGSFSVETDDLTGRRYYEVRAVAETSDGDTARGLDIMFSTENPSSRPDHAGPTDHAGPESASQFELDAGFADPAPWLDDDTPVVKITEPTREMMRRADVEGERLIVFETSGVVDLDYSGLTITNDKCWIAGQTAPSPGIAFIKGTIKIAANDCVVQHIGSYRGERDGPGEGKDALNTGDDTRNNVIDHVSAFWGRDENLSVGYDTENTTLVNCLSAEGLSEPAENSNGSLIGDGAENVAILGTVYAKNIDRNPRLKSETESVVTNNVMFYFDDAVNLDESAVSSVVGNAFLDTVQPDDPAVHHGRAYVEDNYADPEIDPLSELDEELAERPLWPESLDAMASDDVVEHNLDNAGARPADRIDHDQRVVEDVRQGDGEFIGAQGDVGGYPDLEVNTHELDVSNGATRAWIRSWAREVETAD